MILGIGTDIVEIDRFKDWIHYPDSQLKRLFSSEEIAHCKSIPILSAQRFAGRFAAREAIFKALSPNYHLVSSNKKPLLFLILCRETNIQSTSFNAPLVEINWKKLLISSPFKTHLTLSHTHNLAIANVILEKQ